MTTKTTSSISKKNANRKCVKGAAEMSRKKICVKQVRSSIGCIENQKKCLLGLGLGKVGRTKVLEDTPSVRGLVRKVSSLITVVDSNE